MKNTKKITILLLVIVSLFILVGFVCRGKSGVVTKSYGDVAYEFDEDLEIIDVDDSVKDYYEDLKWNMNEALNGLKSTKTYVDDESHKYTVEASANVDGDYSVLLSSTDKSNNVLSCDIRVANDKSYMKVSSNLMDKPSYYMANYDENNTALNENAMFDLEAFKLVYSLKTIDYTASDFNCKIKYNCRTKLDNVLVDDITITFYDSADYTYVAFVDAETHKILRICSSLISNNDYTDVNYDDNDNNNKIKAFTYSESKKSNSGKVSIIDDDTMAMFYDILTYCIYSQNDIDISALSDELDLDKDSNKDSNKSDDKSEVKESGKRK